MPFKLGLERCRRQLVLFLETNNMTETQLRIDRLHLQDVGGFRDMDIRFGPRLNIVCGPNGVPAST